MTEPSEDSIEVPRGGVTWVYASSLTMALVGALFYLYLARFASLEELGAIVVLQAFSFIVATGAALGLGRGFNHFLSFHRARGEAPVVRTFLRISYVTSFLLSLVAVGFMVVVAGGLSLLLFHSSGYTSTIELLGPYVGLITAAMILGGVLLGLQRYEAYGVVYIVGSIGMYGIPIAFFAIWPTVQSIVYGWILGTVVQTGASVVMIQRVTRTVRSVREPSPIALGTMYRTLFTYSAPVLASLLITTGTYYVDRLILASIANLPTVGVYNYAILFASASLFVVGPFAAILVPRISALFGLKDFPSIRALVRNSNTLAVLVFVPLALALAALGPILLRYLVGPAFVAAAVPMAVLVIITAVFVPVNNLVSLAMGTRRTSIVMVSSTCALAGNAAVSIALVPRLGMVGAALGNSAMFWAPFLALYFVLRGTGLLQFDMRSISLIWAASAAGALVIAVPCLLLNYSPVVAVLSTAVGVFVFLASVRVLRAVPPEVTDALHRHLPRWASVLRPVICWAAACDHCRHGEERDALSPAVVVARR